MRLALGLGVALASAVMLNAGFFVQHKAASSMPPLSLRRPVHSLYLLFRDPSWLAGWLAGWGGWGLYIVALWLAPLSLVQAISAGGVGVIALMARRWGKATLARPERIGALACLLGIVLIAASLGARLPVHHPPKWHAVALWVGACAAVAALMASPLSRRLAGGAGLGGAAGLLYAAGDIATKGAVSAVGVFLVPVLLACHLLGFVALQLAFQRGTPLATAGLSTLLNNTVPILAGVIVFGEGIPLDGFGAVRLLGFLAVVFGAVNLARRQAGEETASRARRAARAAEAGVIEA